MYVVEDNKILGYLKNKDYEQCWFYIKEEFKKRYGWFVEFFRDDAGCLIDDYSKQEEINQMVKEYLN